MSKNSTSTDSPSCLLKRLNFISYFQVFATRPTHLYSTNSILENWNTAISKFLKDKRIHYFPRSFLFSINFATYLIITWANFYFLSNNSQSYINEASTLQSKILIFANKNSLFVSVWYPRPVLVPLPALPRRVVLQRVRSRQGVHRLFGSQIEGWGENSGSPRENRHDEVFLLLKKLFKICLMKIENCDFLKFLVY